MRYARNKRSPYIVNMGVPHRWGKKWNNYTM